jgi:hypothetical protein
MISSSIDTPTTFIKQYGAQRTGTNYLRLLLQKNYTGVCMLMHILGDKHSPPAPLDALWAAAQSEPDPPLAFVSSATFRYPSLSTSPDNARQHEQLCNLAKPLTAAYLEGAVGFVITIKNPYAWAVSVAAYEHVIGRGATLGPKLGDFLSRQCLSFNQRYRSWQNLAESMPSRTRVVRHEDLIRDPENVLAETGAKFGLHRNGPFVDEPHVTPMTWWDNTNEPASQAKFDRSYYLEERYLQRLSPQAFEMVTATIDWELMDAFGYAPKHERREC